MSDHPVRPPVPPVPITEDGRRVSREWWRWFANNVANVLGTQAAQIVEIQDTIADITIVSQRIPVDPPPTPLQDALVALAASVPPQDTVSPDHAAMLALSIMLPQDPVTAAAIAAEATVAVNLISSGATDTLSTLASGRTIQRWASATTSAKTQNIPASDFFSAGREIIVKDAVGTANTYPITITPASGTIDGAATFVMDQYFGSVSMVADGAGDWMVESTKP